MKIRRSMLISGVAVVAAGTGAFAVLASSSSADQVVAKATLVDDDAKTVGHVRFTVERDGTVKGRASVQLPTDSAEFHGFHIHANPTGAGCLPGTGFTAVGGHWDVGGHSHGSHTGDLPSLHRQGDGHAELTFVVDKFAVADLLGKAVVVHVGADNFGNVPRGTAANQYTDNGTAYNGTGGTAATGNAGSRFACGVVEAN